MVFPLAIGAVVEGESCDFHTPLSGQVSPVRAVVPIGLLIPLTSFTHMGMYSLIERRPM
jgi:hypothetical protein